VLATHECHPLRDTHYSLNSSTAPVPLIPRRLAPLPGSRRLSTLIAPHVDPTSSGVILTRASPPTTPDSSDSASTPVRVLPQTSPSAIEAKLSSTASLLLAPHSSPSESASQPVPPRVSATRSAFLPFVHLNTRLQPCQDRFQRRHPFCTLRESGHHIAVRSIRVTCPCPRCCCARANEFHVVITQEKVGRAFKSRHSKRSPHLPEAPRLLSLIQLA
jgi:hypothetical protein